jgi:peptidoglycan/LPS O-acetylase OafA/YrhL
VAITNSTIGESVNASRNKFNALRLFLALLVVISHSFLIYGLQNEPEVRIGDFNLTLGSMAVAVFFFLSGYLVTQSATLNSFSGFVFSRFMRVYPAYFLVLVVSGFLLVPLVLIAQDSLNPESFLPDSFFYLIKNSYFPTILSQDIQNVFLYTPFGKEQGISSINGALWTIPLEVRCYGVIALMYLVRRSKRKFVLIAFALSIFTTLVLIQFEYLFLGDKILWSLVLAFQFSIGGIFHLFFSQHEIKPKMVFLFFIFVILMFNLGEFFFLVFGLPLFVISIFLSILNIRTNFSRIFKNDVSYGIYLYGWPVAQVFSFYSSQLHFIFYVVFVVVVTFVFAIASWKIVELPALEFKKSKLG